MATARPDYARVRGRSARLAPGAFLATRFLKPLHLSQEALARHLGVSRRRINEIVRGRRAITPDTALRLGHYFGTGPELWLHLQAAWDLHAGDRRAKDSHSLES
jgi:addiction module HigA family antidote